MGCGASSQAREDKRHCIAVYRPNFSMDKVDSIVVIVHVPSKIKGKAACNMPQEVQDSGRKATR